MRVIYTTAELKGTKVGCNREGLVHWVVVESDGSQGPVQPGLHCCLHQVCSVLRSCPFVSLDLLVSLGDWMRCAASCPIQSMFIDWVQPWQKSGCFLCLLQVHFRSLNEQSLVVGKAQLKWSGKCRQLFGSFRLRWIVWWSDSTYLDWLNPSVHDSLSCSLIRLLIHSEALSSVAHTMNLTIAQVSILMPLFIQASDLSPILGQERWGEERLQSHILGKPWFLGKVGQVGQTSVFQAQILYQPQFKSETKRTK